MKFLSRFATSAALAFAVAATACTEESSGDGGGGTGSGCRSTVTLDVGGTAVTRSEKDGFSALFIGGKFMGMATDDTSVKLGDSEQIVIAANSLYTKMFFNFRMSDDTYAGKTGELTFTTDDGTTLAGTVGGSVRGSNTGVTKVVTGTFSTTCISRN